MFADSRLAVGTLNDGTRMADCCQSSHEAGSGEIDHTHLSCVCFVMWTGWTGISVRVSDLFAPKLCG